jgi:hypothetical protein
MLRFPFRLSGSGLALALLACGPSAVPGSSSHPASASAPVTAEPAAIADPEPAPAADPHAGHGGHAGHAGHGGHGDQAAPAAITDAERVAYEKARPVIERHCARCHAPGGAKATDNTVAHIDLSAYPFSGHHTHELGPALRRVLGADGGAPEMPYDEPGAVKGADLEALLALAAAWTAAHPDGMPAGEHHHHGEH